MTNKLVHETSSRVDGNMSFHWGPAEEVRKNRAVFLSKYGIAPEDCVVMKVGDENVVEEAFKKDKGSLLPADALITKEKDLFLVLVTGDCLPIVCHDLVNGAIGLAHGSRKSTGKKLVQGMVGAFQKKYGSQPKDLAVSIGPGARKESYLLPSPSEQKDPDWKLFLTGLPDGYAAVDLIGYNLQQLKDVGVRPERIEVSPIDTIASRDFFSHYRSKRTGEPEARFMTVIGMRNG